MSLVAAKKSLVALLCRSEGPNNNDNNTNSSSPSTLSPFSSAATAGEQEPLLGGGRRRPAEDDDLESQTSSHTLGSTDSQASTASSSSRRISARIISDATIGLSDGLTVPFALTAGLSALDDTRIVIYGGLAELIAGAISMGLGGYLGAKSEIASYQETLSQTTHMINTDPEATLEAVRAVFAPYDVPKPTVDALAAHISTAPDSKLLPDFLMHFHHREPEPESSRALVSGLTIALGYFLGGLLPLLPYVIVSGPEDLHRAWSISVAVMAVALFSFGYAKTCFVTGWAGQRCVRKGLVGAVQMVVVGGAAAAAAMMLVKLFNPMAEAGGGGPLTGAAA
ncbi:vacuolar iron transporter Ccc1 [Pyricularia oryzae 70-15]|uniref:Vacuolar iron transporter Ccc1 n=3 Tax=Pyricularia oryzae TaxID=318829 RepID=G4ND26_PYRO7|nr:vacuolar iron transporter Ccc1 [Pyricularia oryzae 70-15]EHA48368.1 vacuolar iron transporter Ccc1 [Pyricularia oryzae 70-15]ELQ40087.1 vacuolar iron transporter Ccc1 [Pyricularia oryzae Y34]KAI7916383.1 vacuolar iron transporter Ccc1 [Pyricularia oryzae]KAI7923711.1 vacuolar iron transporter Ccc1 [Pyricularia oryzae]